MKRGSCALLLLTTALVSPAALAEPKYPATVDVFGGVNGDGPGGGLELMAPFAEGEGSLFFGLARGTMWDETGAGGVGLGYRSQALPGWIAATLYRLEVNLRAATILGMVGAGGIGFELYSSLKLFQYEDTAVCVIVILAMVMTADYLSSRLRARILAP